MNVYECVQRCLEHKEFVENFDRLYGSNISRNGAPIELAIDDATGKADEDMEAFVEFCVERVWIPLVERSMEAQA